MLPIIDFANIHPASIRETNKKDILNQKIKDLEHYIETGGKTPLSEEILKDIELHIKNTVEIGSQ